MKPREYCCCAIPLVNAGIYLTLIEHVVVSLLVGILAVATPSSESFEFRISHRLYYMLIIHFKVVGASTPSFASLIMAIICFVVTAVQPLGFIGVIKVTLIYLA